MSGTHRIAQPVELSCEVLVVGSGAGGAAVAATLTRAGLDVLMVEEGPYVPAEHAPAQLTTAFRRMWRGGGLTAALGAPPVAYAEGCCVGGTTEINSAIFQQTPPEVLQTWAQRYDIADFGPEALQPYYARAAQAVHASPPSEPVGAATERLRAGGEALGWRVTALERGHRNCVGTNMCAQGCPTGGKQSMSATLIPTALAQGLRLIAECRIERLVVRRRRVATVLGSARDSQGLRHSVRIHPRQVFLCAGAIQTPALLRAHGRRRNIGTALRMHPTIKAAAVFPETIDAHAFAVPQVAITEFMPDVRLGGSLFSPSTFGMFLAEDWAARGALMPAWRNAGLYYAMVRGQGRGSVRPLPGRGTEPLVRYGLATADWQGLALGLARLGQALFAAGATRVVPGVGGHPGWSDPAQCDEFTAGGLPVGRSNLMTIHLAGSAPPGEKEAACATDSFGRLRGLENLILADASQIPEAPGVNPQATVMALAFRAAEAYLAQPERARRSDALAEAHRV